MNPDRQMAKSCYKWKIDIWFKKEDLQYYNQLLPLLFNSEWSDGKDRRNRFDLALWSRKGYL